MNKEDINTIKELCKEIEPKYKEYISTHPTSDKGIVKGRRTMLIQAMKNTKDFIRAYDETTEKEKRTMYVHSALYCLEKVDMGIN
jgi:hypothetical protein